MWLWWALPGTLPSYNRLENTGAPSFCHTDAWGGLVKLLSVGLKFPLLQIRGLQWSQQECNLCLHKTRAQKRRSRHYWVFPYWKGEVQFCLLLSLFSNYASHSLLISQHQLSTVFPLPAGDKQKPTYYFVKLKYIWWLRSRVNSIIQLMNSI